MRADTESIVSPTSTSTSPTTPVSDDPEDSNVDRRAEAEENLHDGGTSERLLSTPQPYVPPGDENSPYRTILGHNEVNYIKAYPPSGRDRRSLDGLEFQTPDGTVHCGIFTFYSSPDPSVQCWVQGGFTLDGQRCRDLQMSAYSLEHYAIGVYCNTQFFGATNSTVYAGPDRGVPPLALATGESVSWAGAACQVVNASTVRCDLDAVHGFEASTSGVTLL